jgi:uncharacterized protein (UPF0332 family)
MSSSEPLNREAVLIYLDGAQEALRNAQYNLDGDFFRPAISRAYYAFFYAAAALLLTLDITRSKHSGVLVVFREHFVKPGLFSVQDSRAFGEAFQARNLADYQMVGKGDATQARTVLVSARRFVEHCEHYLPEKGYL